MHLASPQAACLNGPTHCGTLRKGYVTTSEPSKAMFALDRCCYRIDADLPSSPKSDLSGLRTDLAFATDLIVALAVARLDKARLFDTRRIVIPIRSSRPGSAMRRGLDSVA